MNATRNWVRDVETRAARAAERDRRLRRMGSASSGSNGAAIQIAKSLAIFFSILGLVHLINQAKLINEFGDGGGDIYNELRPDY